MRQLIQIQPVNFPLNLGVADSLNVNINISNNNLRGNIFYTLFDTSITPSRKLSSGFLNLTEEQITANGNDINWAINYVATELGLTLA
jgi:hypothetical protein